MTDSKATIKRALLSVSDKTGIVELARGLAELGVEIISTGGTAVKIREAGLDVTNVENVTGSPEMLEGRVKTLHPAIHGGILARRERNDDIARIEELGIKPIDLVAVNLYPFAKTVAIEEVALKDALEQIDIGGPTLLRAAAKNFSSVAVVCDPADYKELLHTLRENDGSLELEFRAGLAAKAFKHTSQYDSAIATYLSYISIDSDEVLTERPKFPPFTNVLLEKIRDLRYGENPHQDAALYRELGVEGESLVNAEQLQGKKLSFNNLLDFEGAWQLASEFDGAPFCAIIKHSNPCGAALGITVSEAFEIALACDPVSAFGGVVAFNTDVDGAAAEKMAEIFLEGIVAPGFKPEALDILKKKKRLRVLRCPMRSRPTRWDIRRISGGLLLQDYDFGFTASDDWQYVTRLRPNPEEVSALKFAWRICKHVKSNAIVFTTANRILGVGAGQMSRVDSAKIAAARFDAKEIHEPIAMASDAFFPFRDGLDVGADAGATAVIQPGGSKRDQEVIDAADEHGIAMVFTGRRHFRH